LYRTDGNALDAAAQGAMQGVMLIGNIVANIVAFMAFIAFLDAVVSWLGLLVGLDYLSFQVRLFCVM
jgi:pyrimidine nucleoside transport protein